MTNTFARNLLATAITALLLAGCSDDDTEIVEKDPIVEDDHDHDHGSDIHIESVGRLAVLSLDGGETSIVDLDDNEQGVLGTFTMTHTGNSLYASASNRYAVVVNRSHGLVEFVDGGMWQEDHDEHLHDFEQAPALSSYQLTGIQPTHVVNHDGQTAIFNDGNADTGSSASVDVFTDANIAAGTAATSLTYTTNMHGAAEPRGEFLLASVRRADEDSTSATKVLPDQVAVYHLHDGEYEQDELIDVNCPNLHGAAQNHEFVVFGCSDGVLAIENDGDMFEASKLANIDDQQGMQIGSIWGHEASESFIGRASQHGGTSVVLVSINPEAGEIEALEWQPVNAAPVSYGFSYDGAHFVVLDDAGDVHILEQHEHDGEMHWEHANTVSTTTADLSTMPDGASFSLAISKNDNFVYVADPIAQHIQQIHIEDAEIEGDIELTFAPSKIVWLGIAEEGDHDHDHDH